ncbi:MAG: histidine triad nucleotide-binding protein [Candidatus Planktophila sp.]
MTLDPTCIFCKIIEGEIPAEILYRNENVLAFNDLNPQAPTHVLIIPTLHAESAAQVAAISPTIIAGLHKAADEIAAERSLTGYRTVFNTGADAGQSVFHAHLHLLGGRGLAWPPG